MAVMFNTSEKLAGAPVSVRQRCLNALTLVAQGWGFFGMITTGTVFLHEGSPLLTRVRPFGIAALVVSLALYSVLIPLRHILREAPETSR